MANDLQIKADNWAHPVKKFVSNSDFGQVWNVEFSKEAHFGDRRMDFTAEFRYLANPAWLKKVKMCPCLD